MMSVKMGIDVKPALELFHDQALSKSDSTIRLKWRISEEVRDLLTNDYATEPHLLVVTCQNGYELDRHVFPLDDEMAFIRFPRPGTLELLATIVWRGYHGSPQKYLLKKEHGYRVDTIERVKPVTDALREKRYNLSEELSLLTKKIVNTDEEAVFDSAELEQLQQDIALRKEELTALIEQIEESNEAEASITQIAVRGVRRIPEQVSEIFEVPEAMFAKGLPITRWMGNYLPWSNLARDQCQLRRRALLTVPALPFVIVGKAGFVVMKAVLLTVFNVLAVAVLLLLGMRGLNYQPLRHPLREEPAKLWRARKPSRWWTSQTFGSIDLGEDRVEVQYPPRNPVTLVVNPPALLVMALICSGFLGIWGGSNEVPGDFVGSLTISMIGVCAMIALIIWLYNTNFWVSIENWKEEREQRKAALRREQLGRLTDQVNVNSFSLSALPRQKRSIRLQYEELKSKVCKPLAR